MSSSISGGYLRFDYSELVGMELPYFEASGEKDGPTLTLLAGIHGCEYTSQKAVREFMRAIGPELKRGRIRAIPTVNVDAYFERSAFVSPKDRKNLNRCFPGDPNGSYSEQLAFVVTHELISGSDFLIDLHAGDLVEALHPFTLFDDSPVAASSEELARAYGFGVTIRQTSTDRAVSGTTTSAAAELNIPAIIAESGGRGLLEENAVKAHIDGLWRVSELLEMVEDAGRRYVPGLRTVRRMDRFIWLRTSIAGWWEPAVEPGEEVSGGQLLGTVYDLRGEILEEFHSGESATVVFLTSSPAVKVDGLLIGIASE